MPAPLELVVIVAWVYILYRIGKWDDKRFADKFIKKIKR